MELVGDEAQVKSCFGPFGYSVSISARQLHSLFQTMLGNHFDRTRWNSQVTRLKWNLASVYLERVLVSVQDRCTVSMELLVDEAQVESYFGPFGDSVSISARQVHGLFQTRLGNHFDLTRQNSLVTRLKWNLVLVRLEIVLVSVQDRCMVCAFSTIGLEIILDAPIGTPR